MIDWLWKKCPLQVTSHDVSLLMVAFPYSFLQIENVCTASHLCLHCKQSQDIMWCWAGVIVALLLFPKPLNKVLEADHQNFQESQRTSLSPSPTADNGIFNRWRLVETKKKSELGLCLGIWSIWEDSFQEPSTGQSHGLGVKKCRIVFLCWEARLAWAPCSERSKQPKKNKRDPSSSTLPNPSSKDNGVQSPPQGKIYGMKFANSGEFEAFVTEWPQRSCQL